jgi:CPA2 family monovalent cation:H+ antiporter-2
VIALLLMAPFLRSIVMKKNRSQEFRNLWGDNHFNRGALISLAVLRIVISCTLILVVLVRLFPSYTLQMVIVSMAVIAFIIFFQGFKRQSIRIETRFFENLNQKQRLVDEAAPILAETARHLLSRNIHLEEIDVSPLSPHIGKTLRELNFRERLGLNIVTILRGGRKINIPDAKERLYPYDKLIVAGSDENIQYFMQEIQTHKLLAGSEIAQVHITLSQYVVEPDSPMIGRNVRELDIQNKTECMIINIERGEENLMRIPSTFTFQEGDTLLLAGEADKLRQFAVSVEN